MNQRQPHFFMNNAVLSVISNNTFKIDVNLAIDNINRLIKEQEITPTTVHQVTGLLLCMQDELTGIQYQRLSRMNIESLVHITMSNPGQDTNDHAKILNTKEEVSEYLASIGLPSTGNVMNYATYLAKEKIEFSLDINNYISVLSFRFGSYVYVLKTTKHTIDLLILPYT